MAHFEALNQKLNHEIKWLQTGVTNCYWIQFSLRTFIVDRSKRQIFFRLVELTILAVTTSISRKKDTLTMVSGGSFFKGFDNKIIGFFHI